jgi:hypothetical protein
MEGLIPALLRRSGPIDRPFLEALWKGETPFQTIPLKTILGPIAPA